MKKKDNNDLFKMMSIYQSKQSMELQKAIYQKNNNEIEDIKRTVNQISENQSKLMNKEVKENLLSMVILIYQDIVMITLTIFNDR